MTHTEKTQGRYYDQINNIFFNAEKEDQKYIKQKLVMRLYHSLKALGLTLQDAWNAVKDYFAPVAVAHTCAEYTISTYLYEKLY